MLRVQDREMSVSPHLAGAHATYGCRAKSESSFAVKRIGSSLPVQAETRCVYAHRMWSSYMSQDKVCQFRCASEISQMRNNLPQRPSLRGAVPECREPPGDATPSVPFRVRLGTCSSMPADGLLSESRSRRDWSSRWRKTGLEVRLLAAPRRPRSRSCPRPRHFVRPSAARGPVRSVPRRLGKRTGA